MTLTLEKLDELLPCPFCGSTAVYVQNAGWDANTFMRCPGCHSTFSIAGMGSHAETVAAWNRRTPSREAVLEEAAKVAERDVDWTMFARQPKKDWKTGEETNVFAPMDDPDNTIPTPVNVFAYANGIAAGRAIAAAIRARSEDRG